MYLLACDESNIFNSVSSTMFRVKSEHNFAILPFSLQLPFLNLFLMLGDDGTRRLIH